MRNGKYTHTFRDLVLEVVDEAKGVAVKEAAYAVKRVLMTPDKYGDMYRHEAIHVCTRCNTPPRDLWRGLSGCLYIYQEDLADAMKEYPDIKPHELEESFFRGKPAYVIRAHKMRRHYGKISHIVGLALDKLPRKCASCHQAFYFDSFKAKKGFLQRLDESETIEAFGMFSEQEKLCDKCFSLLLHYAGNELKKIMGTQSLKKANRSLYKYRYDFRAKVREQIICAGLLGLARSIS